VIRLSREQLRTLHAHAEAAYPHECCGALLGHERDGDRVVVALHAADNRREAEAAPRRFLITAEDYRAIEAGARARSLDVIGFYHSHPDHPGSPMIASTPIVKVMNVSGSFRPNPPILKISCS
jgi:proteasome lid subunit RPN8/RPN11